MFGAPVAFAAEYCTRSYCEPAVALAAHWPAGSARSLSSPSSDCGTRTPTAAEFREEVGRSAAGAEGAATERATDVGVTIPFTGTLSVWPGRLAASVVAGPAAV